MASRDNLDDEDVFSGEFAGGATPERVSGKKRSIGDLEDVEDDIFSFKKANVKVEETTPGVATAMILFLRESLKNCQDELSRCQTKHEESESEKLKWRSCFLNESFIPQGAVPDATLVVSYLQTLRSSEESLREQVDNSKKKEAAFIMTLAKREKEIAELKSAVCDLRVQLKPPSMQTRRLLLDPAIHEEFTRLKNLVEEKDKKVKELENDINAVSFDAQSKLGKMLMAKCKKLQEENEEMGDQANEGRIHELTMKLALQRSQNHQLQDQFEGLCKQMEKLAGDVDRSTELVVILQEKLAENEAENRRLKQAHQLDDIVEKQQKPLGDNDIDKEVPHVDDGLGSES